MDYKNNETLSDLYDLVEYKPTTVNVEKQSKKMIAEIAGRNYWKNGGAVNMEQIHGGTIKNANELEFAIFCIENVAAKLGVDADKVYCALAEQSDLLNRYIIPEYEILHTQSKEYIVFDILDVMRGEGITV